MRIFILALVTVFASFLVVSCTPPIWKDTQQKISKAEQHVATIRPQMEKHTNLATRNMSANSITLGDKSAQPGWLSKKVSLRGNKLPFDFYVQKLVVNTGSGVSYEPGTNQNLMVTINYTGTVRGALDALAAKANLAYTISGNTITWSAYVAKTYDISFMPGATQYFVGKNAGVGTNAGSLITLGQNNSQFSSMQGTLSVWTDLRNTLDRLKSPEGQVIVSEATTTVTVKDRPENVRVIGDYLASMDRNLSQEVALDVQVIEVDLNHQFNYGVDWAIVRSFMGGGIAIGGNSANPFNFAGGNSSTISGGANSSLWSFGSAKTHLLINALEQQGKVNIDTQPRVVTLNNQVAEIGINTQTSYLAQMTVTQNNGSTTGNSTSTALTPGVVTDGFTLYLLPKVQGQDVYLQISSTLANLVQFDKQGPKINDPDSRDPSYIQLPTVTEKRFNQRSVLESGHTLVLAGFKQLKNTANDTKVFQSSALGGKGGQQDNNETIVLITPTIVRGQR